MTKAEIREIWPEEAKQTLEYLKKVGSETDNLSFGAEGLPITPKQEREYLQKTLDSEKSIMLGAWKDGEMIADASLNGFSKRMAHRAELGISVLKAQWGKGVGSALMERLIGFAKEKGIEILHLEVRSDNERAIGLYEKFGFKTIGTFPAYIKIRDEYKDVLIMVLDLRETE
ncbi:MAG: GNAT family N-acetyltransferase [Oscillospiraceae bacterium]|nr:GNAT family N-acetyltransferase [Oscillospiraceae bacterium]